VAAAANSSQFADAIGNLSLTSAPEFNSVFFDYQLSAASCAIPLTSIGVAYDLVADGRAYSLSISETPVGYHITGAVLQDGPLGDPVHGPNALWTGDDFSLATQQENPLVIADWIVPGASYPSWGCTFVGAYACDISPWIGITNEAGGGNGIAQAGTNSAIACVLPDFQCGHAYAGWYEFWPNSPVNCLNTAPGDQVQAIAYYSGGEYGAQIADDKTGAFCRSAQAMSMGTPNYAWILAEDEGDGYGGYYETPQFSSVNFQDACIGVPSLNCEISQIYSGDDTAAYHMSAPGTFYWDDSECPGLESCFSISQD
jgi:hypothetical protein